MKFTLKTLLLTFTLGFISCGDEVTVDPIQKSNEWLESDEATTHIHSISGFEGEFTIDEYSQHLSRFDHAVKLFTLLSNSSTFEGFEIQNFDPLNMVNSINNHYSIHQPMNLNPPSFELPSNGIYAWDNDLMEFIYQEAAANIEIRFPLETGSINTLKATIELEFQDDDYYKSTLLKLTIQTIENTPLLVRLNFSYSWYPYDSNEVQFQFIDGTFIDGNYESQFQMEWYFGKNPNSRVSIANWEWIGLDLYTINTIATRHELINDFDHGYGNITNSNLETLGWAYVYNGNLGNFDSKKLELYVLTHPAQNIVGKVLVNGDGSYDIKIKDKNKEPFPLAEQIIQLIRERIE